MLERLRVHGAKLGLSEPCLIGLVERGHGRAHARRGVVLTEGEPASSLQIVLEGRLKMTRSLASGREIMLALLGPGDAFGTVAALGQRSCDATTTALEPTHCLELGREQIFLLLEQRPALAPELFRFLARPLAECRNCMIELSFHRVERRFAQVVLRLADSMGIAEPDGLRIPIRLSRQELADLAGTTLETAIRILSRWRRDGILDANRTGLFLHRRQDLETTAAG